MEGWLYDYRAAGFAALYRHSRRDKGLIRALPPEGVQAILKLRLSQPALPVSALVRQLLAQGVLEPGTFSMPSVYRVLRREGLDRPRLLAETNGPTKAFETELPNTLWMADIMDGPTLRLEERVLRTFLFATLDDCSRLVPHAQYYENEKLRSLLDCLRQAFACRGLPEKLYTDQGKIFTCSHLRVVCANLRIHLLHAQKAAGLRQLPADTDWQRLFLARATRRVRLDATISLEGNLWEVPVHLRGRQVELHYDPFDWSRVEVWYRERFAALARRCDKHLNAKIYSSRDYER